MSDIATPKNPNLGPKTKTSTMERIALAPFDYFLFFVTVLAWSGSWYALKLQVGVVPVQISLFWRYALAALIMMVWVLVARAQMRFSFITHTKFLFMGALMFCINFTLFYNASIYLASGLLSGRVFACVHIQYYHCNFVSWPQTWRKCNYRRSVGIHWHRYDVLASGGIAVI